MSVLPFVASFVASRVRDIDNLLGPVENWEHKAHTVMDSVFDINALGDGEYIYLDISEKGLHCKAGTKEECDTILGILGQGHVVTRKVFIDALKTVNII